MSSATQKRRLIGVSSPLGADTLLLQRFAGSEGLGRLFSFDLELLSDKRHDIDLDKVVGQPMTVRVQLPAGGERYFNGVVSSFVQTAVGRAASDEVYSSYRATLVPWLWLLTRTANCRIFQEMTVPDIIKKIFTEYGFSGFVEDKLTATYPTWEYCVQYRETAFNFVSRLMEQEGIYYYFKHENGKHLLVLCDSPGAHQPFPGYASIPFRPTREKATPAGHITDWAIGKTLQPGKYTHTDYNFKKPRTPMLEDPFSWPFSAIRRPHQHAELEVFDYPGEFRLAPEGDQYAKTRIEELQAQYEVGSGSGTSCGIAPGCTFAMKNSLRADQNRAYLVVATSYTASAAEYATGNPGGGDTFACSFSAIPADTSYRPPRNTPKPTIQGAQTAVVVGPPGEEIYTDEYGRVKVQFHWDREHAYGPDSSCWIRVAQSWAGKKWGILFTPRIAHEVVVEFLEGDPDQPIITGRVYNADHIPPYALPDNKTISTMKSYSSKGGDGFNELRFEDKKGKEQIFIHAQRNLDIRVRNNMYETNYGNREVRVGWEKDGQSGGHLNTLVRLDVNTHIKGGQYEQVEKDLNQTVEGAVVESYKKDQTTQVTGTRTLNAKEVVVETSDLISEKTGKLALEGSQEVGIKGGSVNVESSQGISLKCGGNFVTIDASGVCINGSMVKINSGGAAKPAAAAKSAQLPTIEQPVEARLADDGKTGLATGLKKPPTPARQRTKVALTVIKALAWKPPASEHVISPQVVGPPQTKSDKPCGIGELSVLCSHKRKPGPNGVLQVVPDSMATSTIEKNWGPVKVKVTKKSKGAEQLESKVVCNQPGVSGRKQLAFLETAGSPSTADWKNKSTDQFKVLPSLDDDIWPINAKPRLYYVHGRGCDDCAQQITIESYPSQQHSFELSLKFFDDWAKAINKGWEDWGDKFMGVSPVKLKPRIDGPAGSLSGSWGWKEDKDWRAYFQIAADIGLDPIFGVGIDVKVSMVEIAGTAIGIPPLISGLLAEHLADIIVTAGAGLKAKFTGGPRGRFYATGEERILGEATLAVEGSLTLKLTGRLGSDYIASGSVTLGGETKIVSKAKGELEREGLFVEPSAKLKPLTIEIVVKLKAFCIFSHDEKLGKWTPWDEIELYKGARTKILPG